MSDPLISRFADQCGATGPLDLRVELADGGVLAEGTVNQPFTLVGRDDACDVTLTDPDVNPRHLWLQAVGGRVFGVDLGTRTGLRWPDGSTGSGWVDVGWPVGVGPFQIYLRAAASPRPALFPDNYSPLHSDPAVSRTRPVVALEFLNGRRAKDGWTVNRLITLIGRSQECKIHLNADDIASYHCGLVLTPGGLWMVDLSGRGVVVNGERMRVAPLPHGTEVRIGRFLIGCVYPGATSTPAGGRPGSPTPPTPLAFPAPRTVPQPTARPDEEVSIGTPDSGFPPTHIFDDFRYPSEPSSAAGPISHAITVSGTLPPPTAPVTTTEPAVAPTDELTVTAEVPAPDPTAFAVLRQLGQVHGQMIDQLHQSLTLMTERAVQVAGDNLLMLRAELTRLAELNAELGQLQADALRASRPSDEPAAWASPSAPTPVPAADAIRDWVFERFDALSVERQTRWKRVVALIAGKTV